VPDCIFNEIGPFALIALAVTLPMCRILANTGFLPNVIASPFVPHKEFRLRHVLRSVSGSLTYWKTELRSGENHFGESDGKICFMREGLTGRVNPVAEKPLAWCIEKVGLQTKDWWGHLETQFTIDKWLELSGYSRPRWVLLRLEEIEASGEWKSGYYFSPMMKVDQVKKLIA
jgi:hypothetical protein